MRVGIGERDCWQSEAAPPDPAIRQREIIFHRMDAPAAEARSDIGSRDMMAVLRDALTGAGNRLGRTGEPKFVHLDLAAGLAGATKQRRYVLLLRVLSSAKMRCMAREACTSFRRSRSAFTLALN